MKNILESKESNNTNIPMPKISEESRQAFIRAMKIGYYKAFYKQGLLTSEQLEKLIDMNTVKIDNNAADTIPLSSYRQNPLSFCNAYNCFVRQFCGGIIESFLTSFKLSKYSFANPAARISRHICSIGFISGVYGGIKSSLMFSGNFNSFDLCQLALSPIKNSISFGYFSDNFLR